MVIPVSDEFDEYAKEVTDKIRKNGLNCEVDLKNHNLNYKIREHSLQKYQYCLFVEKKKLTVIV